MGQSSGGSRSKQVEADLVFFLCRSVDDPAGGTEMLLCVSVLYRGFRVDGTILNVGG